MDKELLGIVGGGQLGRMMISAASNLGIPTIVLDPSLDCPCYPYTSKFIQGSLSDETALEELIAKSSVVTIEMEHINAQGIKNLLNKYSHVKVFPNMDNLLIIQDKYKQKCYLKEKGFPTPTFCSLKDLDTWTSQVKIKYPIYIKSKHNAYDGHGTTRMYDQNSYYSFKKSLSEEELDHYYAEEEVQFFKELSVLLACPINKTEDMIVYPVVETYQRNNVCDVAIAPAQVPYTILNKAVEIAKNVIKTFYPTAGLFCVELFALANEDVLINEIAPRPHNSGHFSIDGCSTSQFENHVRAVMGYPLGDPSLNFAYALMANIIGSHPSTSVNPLMINLNHLGIKNNINLKLHWYNKKESRPGRKLGHLTLCGDSLPRIINTFCDLFAERQLNKPNFYFRLPFGGHHFYGTMDYTSSFSNTLQSIRPNPIVGIIMGSDSDLDSMTPANQILKQFNIPHEVSLVSAHRTPDRLSEYAKKAIERGIKVIIAGAGGAAHLPGMIASYTTIPVIGVPIVSHMSSLNGVDALYSVVQMPAGVPVATVAIGNADNAAFLALRILSLEMPSVKRELIDHQEKMKQGTEQKNKSLESNNKLGCS